MSLIYNILSKHFLNETTEAEEKQIAKFKKDNPTEYEMLAELWKRGDIKVKDFDTFKAWRIVQNKLKTKKQKSAKIIPLYQKIRRIAAAVAILIAGTISTYYIFNSNNATKTIIALAGNNETGKEILLSDGTKVWLNQNATLSYPVGFGKNNRKVSLTGEAFFEVSKNKDKPFIINAANSMVQVLGTSFNINSNASITNVTVATGKVSVSNFENNDKKIITPGYSAIVNKFGVKKQKTQNTNYLSWKTGAFTFENVKIKEVVSDLNTYYKTQIEISPTVNIECNLMANFEQAELEEVLEIIKITCNIHIKKEHNKYILY